jgi:hypothetical protein
MIVRSPMIDGAAVWSRATVSASASAATFSW